MKSAPAQWIGGLMILAALLMALFRAEGWGWFFFFGVVLVLAGLES